MGDNDKTIIPFYKTNILPVAPVALLGSSDHNMFEGDLYDLKIGNWDINTKWDISKRYNTVICTRCAYFSKNPLDFFRKVHCILNDGGRVYVDWGLGDHWRFKNFKIGWVKNGEQEFAYKSENYLWSCVWDEAFMTDNCIIQFGKAVEKYGYVDIQKAIYDECPVVCHFSCLKNANLFRFEVPKMIYCEKPNPSVLILLEGVKI